MENKKSFPTVILGLLLFFGLILGFVLNSNIFSSKPFNTKNIKYEIPQLEYIVSVDDDIEVPANHVMVLLKEDKGKDIKQVAESIDGKVVGEFTYIELYQIETKSTTLEELNKDIEKVLENESVEYAGYHNHSSNKIEIVGQPCKLLEDLYENEAYANPYEMIGLEKAWQYIHATGIKLNKVKVGVADTGLHMESSDGDAGPKIRVLNKDDEQKGSGDYNSHGTRVSNVLGAGWKNSGMRGVAGGLDNNMEVYVSRLPKNNQSYIEIDTDDYDPDDPTQVMRNNKAYLVRNLHEIMKQVEEGVEVVNYSWGSPKPSDDNNFDNQVYRRFLQKMQEDNPKVVFVAAAGNEAVSSGTKLDGNNYDMGGTPMDNLITVGSLDADGNISSFSNRVEGDGEVTINAQGRAVPVGFNEDGTVKTSNGTSFSTPQVSGAVAILKSINPELTAIEIKNILRETADTSIKGIDIPQDSGGRVMRLDKAVLKVLSDVLDEELDAEKLLAVAIINSVAKQNPKDEMNYTIIATLPEVRKTPVGVELSFSGQGSLGGSTKRSVSSATDIEWDWSFISNDNSVYITITRKDSNACTRIYIEQDNIAGTYEGEISVSFPEMEYFISDVMITGEGTRSVNVPVTIVIDEEGNATFSFSTEGNIDFSTPELPMSMDYNSSGDIPGSIDKQGVLTFEGIYTGGYTVNLPSVYHSIMPADYLANLTGQMSGTSQASGRLEGDTITGTINFTTAEGYTSSSNYSAVKTE